MSSFSELRFDLVSKNWVVIATGRAKRPDEFAQSERKKTEQPLKDCPFCNISNSVAEGSAPILVYLKENDLISKKDRDIDIKKINEENNWLLVVIPNKYPAFQSGKSLNKRREGPYSLMNGTGFHEVVITRDHQQQIANLSVEEIKLVLDAYQERYLDLMDKKLVNYISIFHNHGAEAGASVVHPHSQIIAIPLIDPDLQSSLNGSRKYMKKYGECVHCAMLNWEKKDRQRVIYENNDFIIVAPFASHVSFETRIYPKKHQSYFEKISDGEKLQLADAFKQILFKIYKGLNDPAYNFFLHTAPCDGGNYDHYHWHFEILPKTAIWAGFELGVGIEISVISPENAAKYLREINIL